MFQSSDHRLSLDSGIWQVGFIWEWGPEISNPRGGNIACNLLPLIPIRQELGNWVSGCSDNGL